MKYILRTTCIILNIVFIFLSPVVYAKENEPLWNVGFPIFGYGSKYSTVNETDSQSFTASVFFKYKKWQYQLQAGPGLTFETNYFPWGQKAFVGTGLGLFYVQEKEKETQFSRTKEEAHIGIPLQIGFQFLSIVYFQIKGGAAVAFPINRVGIDLLPMGVYQLGFGF
jgi:hypothetical protein